MPMDPKTQVAGRVKPSVCQVPAAFTFTALFCLSENALQLIELFSVINLRWKNYILGRSGSPSFNTHIHIPSSFQSLFVHNSSGFKGKDLECGSSTPLTGHNSRQLLTSKLNTMWKSLKQTEMLGLVRPEVFEIP